MKFLKPVFFLLFIGFVPSWSANSIYFNSSYSSWESELLKLKYNGIEVDNKIVNDYNSFARFNDIEYNFSINGSYEFLEGLNANLGIGLSYYNFDFFDKLEDKDNSTYTIVSNAPGYFANFGFSYNFSLTEAIHLNILPSFRYYLHTNSTKQENIDDGLYEYNIDIDKNIMSWKVPVIITYDFNLLMPFAGVSYSDYIYDMSYKSTMGDVFGNVDDFKREFTFRKISKINIILGAKYSINPNFGILFRAEFLDGYDFNFNFITNL